MATDDVEVVVAEPIEDTVKLLLECKEEGSHLSKEPPPSIFMVPSALRDSSPASFKPRMVCIGPLHRHEEILQGFEGQKATYLHHLLGLLDSQPEQTLNECVKKVSGSINRIKACYGGVKKSYTDVELAKMMVLDGCFILDFVHRLSDDNDILLDSTFVTQSIIYDLLVIENQIPFFVLEDIFECTFSKIMPTAFLTDLMGGLLGYYNIFKSDLHIHNFLYSKPTTDDNIHILGFMHNMYRPVHGIPSEFESIPKAHSAVELDMAGVYFTPSVDENWALAMKLVFQVPEILYNPTLRMPILCIDDFTDLVLRNFIAYEQCFQVPKYVTVYVCAMDTLVDTPEDVAVLVKSKVLVNKVSSNEKAAHIINNICKELPMTECFFYHREWKLLDDKIDGYRLALSRARAFKYSWKAVALCGGIVLFFLTLVQTIYTVKSANS